jgi:hypothetical protein
VEFSAPQLRGGGPSYRRFGRSRWPHRGARRLGGGTVRTRAVDARHRGGVCYVAQQACSSAAASLRTPTTSVLPSHVRSAARSAMSSRSHSVVGIIVRCIGHVTSARGGGKPALIRSNLPAGSGKKRAKRQRRSQRAPLPPPHGAAAPSDPVPKNEDISATATTQEETPLSDLPGYPSIALLLRKISCAR